MASTDMFMAIIQFKKLSTSNELKSLKHMIPRVPRGTMYIHNIIVLVIFVLILKIILFP